VEELQPAVPVDGTPMEQPSAPPVIVPTLTAGTQPEIELPTNLAILPSRDAVLYPGMLLPMQASDQQWVRLLSDAVSARQPIALVLLKEPQADTSNYDNLHRI